jgi:hypothetical protein
VPHRVPAQSRLSVDLDAEDPRLHATTAAATVRSDGPIAVERVSWWPAAAPYEGSASAGATEAGRRWAVASAPYATNGAIQTYVLVSNPSAVAGTGTIELTGADATGQPLSCARTFSLPAFGRASVSVSDVCAGTVANGIVTFSGTLTSNGPGIVAERSTYWNTFAPDQFWGAGSTAALTRLPDQP